jgi:pyruvate, orthophosphate dikinase
MGKPCITTLHNASISLVDNKLVLISSATGITLQAGDLVTVDGGGGRLLRGLRSTVSHFQDADFQTVLGWADKYRKLRINACIPMAFDVREQVRGAQRIGADGIGCVNTDALFNGTTERLDLTRNILIRTSGTEKQQYVYQLGEIQKANFRTLFHTAKDRTVAVQLANFSPGTLLPSTEEEIVAFVEESVLPAAVVRSAILRMVDKNPDFGLRGCRILAQFPEIFEMQVEFTSATFLSYCLFANNEFIDAILLNAGARHYLRSLGTGGRRM